MLRLSGDLDLATAPGFRALVDGALAAQPPFLVLDLADVDFLDSSGISVIAYAFKGQRATGGVLALTNPQPIVQRALDLVGLSMLFDLAGVPAPLLV